MARKLSVVFSSHHSDEENEKFIKHLKETAVTDIHVECIVNKNRCSLTQAYNEGWAKLDHISGGTGTALGEEIIVFCHNDIELRTKGWDKILIDLFGKNNIDVIGLASTPVMYKHGCWWLSEDGKTMSKNLFGKVYHTNGVREWLTEFSKKINGIKNAVVVDGLFVAVDGKSIVGRYNESYLGYHFYEVEFCVRNFLDGNNIGVIDKISILHKSMGQTNAQWEENRKQFIEEYDEYLPLSI